MELEEGFVASPWKRLNQFYPDGRLAYGKQNIYYLYSYLSVTANNIQRDGIHL